MILKRNNLKIFNPDGENQRKLKNFSLSDMASIPLGVMGSVEGYEHLGLTGVFVGFVGGVLSYEFGRQIISDGIDSFYDREIILLNKEIKNHHSRY